MTPWDQIQSDISVIVDLRCVRLLEMYGLVVNMEGNRFQLDKKLGEMEQRLRKTLSRLEFRDA